MQNIAHTVLVSVNGALLQATQILLTEEIQGLLIVQLLGIRWQLHRALTSDFCQRRQKVHLDEVYRFWHDFEQLVDLLLRVRRETDSDHLDRGVVNVDVIAGQPVLYQLGQREQLDAELQVLLLVELEWTGQSKGALQKLEAVLDGALPGLGLGLHVVQCQ